MTGQVYKRWDLINWLIQRFEYKKYLEIGVQSGLCFDNIKCQYKIGVDPGESHVKFQMTSDEFFKQNEETFDIIFIDGLHESPQVYKDIINSLEVLNDGGVIVCHDMLPANEAQQQIPRGSQKIWNGDCWKAFVQLRASRNDLAMCTVNSDHGLGVIMKGEQDIINIEGVELNWSSFGKYSEEWMNKISYQELYELLGSYIPDGTEPKNNEENCYYEFGLKIIRSENPLTEPMSDKFHTENTDIVNSFFRLIRFMSPASEVEKLKERTNHLFDIAIEQDSFNTIGWPEYYYPNETGLKQDK